MTRVITFKTGRDAQNRVFPESGSSRPFHPSSHHGNNEKRIMEFNTICQYRFVGSPASSFLPEIGCPETGPV